jgi:hypothetical protein
MKQIKFSELDNPVFTSFLFAKILSFFFRARSSALLQTPNLEGIVAFYDSQGYGGGSNTPQQGRKVQNTLSLCYTERFDLLRSSQEF